MRRRMVPAELFRLMGWEPTDIVPLSSARAMGRLAGNSIAVPVLTWLYEQILPQLFDEL